MPIYTYKDFPCTLFPYESNASYRFVAQSLSISFKNQLSAKRSFGVSQDLKEFGIGGTRDCFIDLSWLVCSSGNPTDISYNALSGVMNHMTGDASGSLSLGPFFLENVYLSKMSVSVQPFEPVIASASFICLEPNIQPSEVGFLPIDPLPPQKVAYGYTTTIIGGASLTDSNNSSIQFSINCDRTPSIRIGDSGSHRLFLNGVTKELALNATNIGSVIDYKGYGESFEAILKNIDAENIVSLTMGANSKITSQNLTIQDNSVVNGSVVMQEIVF